MLEVQDDGAGGIPQDALGSKASGRLEGIRRRLATFDGEMFVSSPAEGPTSGAHDCAVCRIHAEQNS